MELEEKKLILAQEKLRALTNPDHTVSSGN